MKQQNKLNSSFFYHDADMRNDIKVKALRRKFGHTGYAVWCCLLEMLTDEDGLELDFTEVSRELIAADLDVDVEHLNEIVAFCQRINLLQMTDDGRLFSKAHQERLSHYIQEKLSRSEAARIAGLKSAEARRLASEQKVYRSEATAEQSFNTNERSLNDCSAKSNHIRLEEKREEKIRKEKDMVMPYQEVVDLWNSTCLSLPKVRQLNDNRRTKIRCRMTEFGKTPEEMMNVAKEVFQRCEGSDFLRGGNNNNWQATFDWVFENATNWVKVMEGNYDNGRGSQKTRTQGSQALGVGEYITPDGRRTYGSGKANLPMSAPPRPSERHAWNSQTQEWVLL